jgi:PKD repeat protein
VYRANQSDLSDRARIATVNASRNFSYADRNLTNGVVSYYQTTAVDADGQESDFSYRAHARPSSNPLGVAFEHTNNASYGTVSARHAFNFRQEMTMEAWINFQANSATDAFVIKRQNGYYMQLLGGDATRKVALDLESGIGGYIESPSALSAGQWHHVAATNDGSQVTLYIDGQQVAQSSIDAPGYNQNPPSATLAIGANPAATSNWFNGQLDEVRLWKTARSSSQISDAYDRELTGYERGLVGYWRGCDVPSDTSATRGSARKPMTQTMTSVSCVPNTNTDAQTGGGQTTIATVTLSGAPDGLRGYRVRLNATNGAIVEQIEPVFITGDGFAVQAGGAGTSGFTAAGVEVTTDSGTFSDNRTLLRARFAGNVTRSDVQFQVQDLLDDNGTNMDKSRVSYTLSAPGGSGPSGSPFSSPLPNSGGSAPPKDPDNDGLYEDIDGDGNFNFVDVISLVFSLQSIDNLSQAQTAAIDFDGSGTVNFVDVIELVFALPR